ncbi:hypothetical protein Tco_1028009 [Tanacetum coccineum]
MTARFTTTQARILEALNEASKGTNTLAKKLKGLDKQFERKEDGGLYLECLTCSKVEAEHQKPSRLLQHLEIPE